MIEDFKFDMKYDTFTGKNNNIDKYISTVKYSVRNITNISFDNMISVFEDYKNLYLTSEKSFDDLLKDEIECIKYFQDKDLITIPATVYTIVDKDDTTNYEVLFAFYNLNRNNKWGFNIPTIITDKLPNITAKKLATVEKKYYNTSSGLYILFNNLPQSLYNNVIIEEQGIMYNLDKKEYFTQNMNQEELFKRIESIATNGFEKPLEMLISSEGLLPLNMSQEDFLIALYLNLPSIPVAFISSNAVSDCVIRKIVNKTDADYPSYVIKKVDNTFNKEELQTILEPYFIFD